MHARSNRQTTILLLGLGISAALSSSPVRSETYKWFYISDVKAVCTSSTCAQVDYSGKINYYTVTTTSEKLDQRPTLYGILPGFDRRFNNGNIVGTSLPGFYMASNNATWREILQNVPASATTFTSRLNGGSTDTTATFCTQAYEFKDLSFGSVRYLPPDASSECATAPPPDQWCAPTTSKVDLAYGTLSSSQAQGAQASANIDVSCTSSAVSYKLKLSDNKNFISLSNGMTSTLSINGQSLSSATFKGSQTALVLRGTLGGTATTTGAFSGTGVLSVEYN